MDYIGLSTTFFLSQLELCKSMYGCPGGGILSGVLGGIGGGYAGFGGYGRCGPDTIFYHWTCCDYNAYDCCIQLEVWVIRRHLNDGKCLYDCFWRHYMARCRLQHLPPHVSLSLNGWAMENCALGRKKASGHDDCIMVTKLTLLQAEPCFREIHLIDGRKPPDGSQRHCMARFRMQYFPKGLGDCD